ncbi:MAG: hypothetical protein JWP00_2088 [Chloroflexi bacterium]|nr:hypothetical protein [Chloroflexota bacterium]
MYKIRFGVAKVNKYASKESGDTVEIVERPLDTNFNGGLTAILVDGQGSGRSAKQTSNFVASHCAALVKQGVRDGAVARAANDQLYFYKSGGVSATLNLISLEFATNTLILTRNNPLPVYLGRWESAREPELSAEAPTGEAAKEGGELKPVVLNLEEDSVALGIYQQARPVVQQFELTPGMLVVVFSDGILHAGERYNPGEQLLDVAAFTRQKLEAGTLDASQIADDLLELAIAADRRRPQDDMSVVVLTVGPAEAPAGTPSPRRMSVEI